MTVDPQTVVILSIDAVAPRYVTPLTMPNLVALGRAGAACFQARTVNPPITMPAGVPNTQFCRFHASLSDAAERQFRAAVPRGCRRTRHRAPSPS